MAKKDFRTCPLVPLLLLVSLLGPVGADGEHIAEPRSAKIDEALARSVVDRIVLDVQRLRGLDFKDVVPVSVVNDDQAIAQHLRRLEEFGELEEIRSAEIIMKVLGMANPDDNVLELFLDALREQVGGYYDPKQRQFYLLDDMPAALVDILTAHELTHALEDQHYDLDSLLESKEADDDQIFARGSVTEGSATLLMTIFSVEQALDQSLTENDILEMSGISEEAVNRMPKALLRQMMAPYVVGMSFVQRGNPAGWMAGGFPTDDINRVYEHPPLSSEQILHPEKYWDENERDDPIPVSLGSAGDLLGAGWTREAEGVLGEINLGVMVGATTPDPTDPGGVMGSAWTNQAASGWGGDRYELWTRGKKAVVLLSTVWDTDRDAGQFLQALDEPAAAGRRLEGRYVALVYGQVPRKKLGRVLESMLRAAPQP